MPRRRARRAPVGARRVADVDAGALYDDGLVKLDDGGITLRRYYFPIATSKHIPYTRVRRVESRPQHTLTGKGRIWGSGDFTHWAPLDPHRVRKETAVILHLDGRVMPSFSPEDPETVVRLIEERITPPAGGRGERA